MSIQKKKTSPALFVRQVRQEMQKVTWPERKDIFVSSAIVILLIVVFSLFFLLTDQIWSFSIRKVIQFGAGL
tara:strand:- start:392 stop:607 length:216 start_codon:yes stop_codon:yes gene_type:complete